MAEGESRGGGPFSRAWQRLLDALAAGFRVAPQPQAAVVPPPVTGAESAPAPLNPRDQATAVAVQPLEQPPSPAGGKPIVTHPADIVAALLTGPRGDERAMDVALGELAAAAAAVVWPKIRLEGDGWKSTQRTYGLGASGSAHLYVSACTVTGPSGEQYRTRHPHLRFTQSEARGAAVLDSIALALGRPSPRMSEDVPLRTLHEEGFVRARLLGNPPGELRNLLIADPAFTTAELLFQCRADLPTPFTRELIRGLSVHAAGGRVEARMLGQVLSQTLGKEGWHGPLSDLMEAVAMSPAVVPATVAFLERALGWQVFQAPVVELGHDPDGRLFLAACTIRAQSGEHRTRRARVTREPNGALTATMVDLICDIGGFEAPRRIAGQAVTALADESFEPSPALVEVADPTLAGVLLEDRQLFLAGLRLATRRSIPPPLAYHLLAGLVARIRAGGTGPEMLAELFARPAPGGERWEQLTATVATALRSTPGGGIRVIATAEEVERDKANLEEIQYRLSVPSYVFRVAFNRAAKFDLLSSHQSGDGTSAEGQARRSHVEALVEVATSDAFREQRRNGGGEQTATYFAAQSASQPPHRLMPEYERVLDMRLGNDLRSELGAAFKAGGVGPQAQNRYLSLFHTIWERRRVHKYLRSDMDTMLSTTAVTADKQPVEFWEGRLLKRRGEVTFRWWPPGAEKGNVHTLDAPSIAQALGHKGELDGIVAAKGRICFGAHGSRGVDAILTAVYMDQGALTVRGDRYAIFYHLVTGRVADFRDCIRLLVWLRPGALSELTRDNWPLTPSDIAELQTLYPEAASDKSLTAIMGIPTMEGLIDLSGKGTRRSRQSRIVS